MRKIRSQPLRAPDSELYNLRALTQTQNLRKKTTASGCAYARFAAYQGHLRNNMPEDLLIEPDYIYPPPIALDDH